MEQKHLHNVPSSVKSNYMAGLAAFDKGNLDYAILLFKGCVNKEPGFMEARAQLRKMEKQATDSASFFKKLMNKLKGSASVAAASALLTARKPLEAMRKAEDALALDLSSLQALMLLAQAAEQLGANFISIEALEIAREYNPKNISVLDKLANTYILDKKGNQALRVRQEIANLLPGKLEAQQKVREAAALASIEGGGWEGTDDYRDILKNQGEAEHIEQVDRITRSVDDVTERIAYLEKELSAGKTTLDNHRKLADLYQKAEEYDKSIEFYNKVIKEMGALDPLIDKSVEKSTLGKFDVTIRQWKEYLEANPDQKEESEKNIAELEKQKYEHRLSRSIDRVNTYPNDLQLRYNLACAYWDGGDVENALQQFQLSQKNPQRRLSSFVYLGRCFSEKGQHDMAVEQFSKAIAEMVMMDNQKMDAVYYLGLTYELLGKKVEALECFKNIYQTSVKYRDVGERINKAYAK